jgi:hypothetical protein
MFQRRRRSALTLGGVFFLAATSAHAIVLLGSDTAGTNNLVAPTNGAPWQYVASIDSNAASGVYLGYGYILTANHVTGPLASASINGSIYAIDQSYVPFQIGGADLKLLRILGDPLLAPLEFIRPQDADTGRDVTVIAWGAGKGTELPEQGWNWGDASTNVQRWGLNTTGTLYQTINGLPYLHTDFNRPLTLGPSSFGDDEASLALGDSGGGLFAKYGTTWRLIGVAAAVSTPGQSLYDAVTGDLGDTPSRAFYVPIQQYRNEIIAAIPEPGAAMLLAAGGLLLGFRRRIPR